MCKILGWFIPTDPNQQANLHRIFWQILGFRTQKISGEVSSVPQIRVDLLAVVAL